MKPTDFSLETQTQKKNKKKDPSFEAAFIC